MTAIMTSREFNQHTNRAQRQAEKTPVIITNRGKPAHVLLSYADYQELTRTPVQSLFDCFAQAAPEAADIEFEIPPRSKAQRRAADFEE